ncbi:MAG TPA: CSLREA domain-containing protein [Bryobacteraceae bacterium]
MQGRRSSYLLKLVLLLAVCEARGATFTIADGDVTNLKSALAITSVDGEDDTINLAANGTYTLTAVDNVTANGPNGLPAIEKDGHNLTINGNGATIARSTTVGTPTFRILEVVGNASINNLILQSGAATGNGSAGGGGIFNGSGTLSLQGCTFSGNTTGTISYQGGGALRNQGGTVNVTSCSFNNNSAVATGGESATGTGGGAIINAGTLVAIVNSSFTSNYATGYVDPDTGQTYNRRSGGSIYNLAHSGSGQNSVTLTNSVLSGDSSNGEGGAIFNQSYVLATDCLFVGNRVVNGGSAIFNSATATIQNCTLSSNYATEGYGGIGTIEDEATADTGTGNSVITVLACTFADNSASADIYLHQADSLTVTLRIGDTILGYRSRSGSHSIVDDNFQEVISLGYNICVDLSTFISNTGDRFNTDPKLDPAGLQNNGGPTLTYGLVAGSPAINGGKAFGLTTDQRGQARPYNLPGYANASGGDGSDIGAYEATDTTQTGSNLVVTSLADHDDGVAGDTDCTLREAINRANNLTFTQTITFSPGLTGTLTLSLGELDVTDGINLNGPGARLLAISGNSAGRVFNLSGGSSVFSAISGLTIRDGAFTGTIGSSAAGGGILNAQNLTVTDCEFTGNHVTGGGGPFDGRAGGAGQGGAIFSSEILNLTGCTFASNVATGGNGAVGLGRISGGTGGAAQGAALYNASSSTLTNCTFYGNGAFGGNGNNGSSGGNGGQGAGGAVANTASITLLACTVDDNSANGGTGGTGSSGGNGAWGATNGGGLVNLGNTFSVTDTIVGDNTKNSSSGGSDVDGTFVSGGYNLIGYATGSTGFTATGDMTGIPTGVIGPTSNTGGPTDTLTFFSNSPAIDASSDAVAPHRDQRGYLRTGRSDIGAFEYNGSLVNLISVNRSGLDLVIQAEVVQGKLYSLQRKANITDSQWQTLLPYKTATGNDTETFTDSNVFSSLSRAFYEVSFAQ